MTMTDDFALANEALENILGGSNMNGTVRTFSFMGANAVQEAKQVDQVGLNCACSCFCNDGSGGGGGGGN